MSNQSPCWHPIAELPGWRYECIPTRPGRSPQVSFLPPPLQYAVKTHGPLPGQAQAEEDAVYEIREAFRMIEATRLQSPPRLPSEGK